MFSYFNGINPITAVILSVIATIALHIPQTYEAIYKEKPPYPTSVIFGQIAINLAAIVFILIFMRWMCKSCM